MALIDPYAHLRCATCDHFRAAHHYQPGPPNSGRCLAFPSDGCEGFVPKADPVEDGVVE